MRVYMGRIRARQAEIDNQLSAVPSTVATDSATMSRRQSVDDNGDEDIPRQILAQTVPQKEKENAAGNDDDDQDNVSTTSSGHVKTARYKSLPLGLSDEEDESATNVPTVRV